MSNKNKRHRPPTVPSTIGEKIAAVVDAVPTMKGIKCERVTSLEVLQQACRKTVYAQFMHDKKAWEIEVQRLDPVEDAVIEHILNGVLPPMKEGKNPGEWIPDLANVDYQRRKAAAELEARSVALYYGVPLFRNTKPGLVKNEEIHAFVKPYWNSDIQNMLYQSIRTGGISVAELVNFPSTSPSTQS